MHGFCMHQLGLFHKQTNDLCNVTISLKPYHELKQQRKYIFDKWVLFFYFYANCVIEHRLLETNRDYGTVN
ncbi:hypothetical protein I7I53_06434 [Histoplasma capsulatum var. duboisii H88]|uniref:Uncharacterized protein n=1 Tax=Ajellomyces capsulatus (strain H88) TaxID=544711 RepID=A0A8A1LBT1_AJEC8|nr:hypothetical protein I7I53_06434 [Histoplasma capsulatum var. duboisii H88]